MLIETRSIKASANVEHAGMACHGKAASSVVHALKPCLMFGASASMRHANGRNAHAQSGCLSFGSLLTNQQRQSATRHRHVAGRPAAASDRTRAQARSTNKQHAARKVGSMLHANEPSQPWCAALALSHSEQCRMWAVKFKGAQTCKAKSSISIGILACSHPPYHLRRA